MDGDIAIAPVREVRPARGCEFQPADVQMTCLDGDDDEENLSDFTDEGACFDGGSGEEGDSSVAESAAGGPDEPLPDLSDAEWRKGWTRWSKQRRRARMAQFIIAHLHSNDNARWIDITRGKFELQRWPDIAQEWYEQKERGSDRSDATSMLRKGLPRAFPGLCEKKDEARKDGTQYIKRVFFAPHSLMKEVAKCALDPKQEDSYSSSEEQSVKSRKSTSTSGSSSTKPRAPRSTSQQQSRKKSAPSSNFRTSESVNTSTSSPPSVEMSEASVFSTSSSPDTNSPPEQGYYTDETLASNQLNSTSSHGMTPSPQSQPPPESQQQQTHQVTTKTHPVEVKVESSDPSNDPGSDLTSLLSGDSGMPGVSQSDLCNLLMSYDGGDTGAADADDFANDPVVEAMDTRYNYTGSTMESMETPQMPSFYHETPDLEMGSLTADHKSQAIKSFQQHAASQLPTASQSMMSPGQPFTSIASIAPQQMPQALGMHQVPRRDAPPPYHQQGMGLLHLDARREPVAPEMEMLTQQVQLRGPWQGKVKISPDRSPLQGGGQIFLFSTAQYPLPQFPTHLVFYSPKLNSMVCVPTMPSNPFTMQGTIPEHVFAETVSVFMMVGEILLAHMLFEYYDSSPNLGMELFSGHIADRLHQVEELLGSMTRFGGLGRGGGGGGGGLQGLGQGEGQYQQYKQMLQLTVSLDVRPLARLLLTSPAATHAVSEQFGNGQRLEDLALERGHRQMASCLAAIRLKHEQEQLGKPPSSTNDPLDLLECTSSSPNDCVMSLCKALVDIKVAAEDDEATGKSEEDSVSMDADDENSSSEPETHQKRKLVARSPSSANNDRRSAQAKSPHHGRALSFANAARQSSDRDSLEGGHLERSEAVSANTQNHLEQLYSPKKLSLEDLAPRTQPFFWMPNIVPALGEKSKSLGPNRSVRLTTAEQLRRVQEQYQKALTELTFLRKAVHDLQQEQRTSAEQLIGMQHAFAMLNDQYKHASQRRDEAVKQMVHAKNEARRVRREADKFESDYQDAMRQRDEALKECDVLGDKLQDLRKNMANQEELMKELQAKKGEVAKFVEKCTQLQRSADVANEARDKAMEERKVVMGGLEAALKQSEMKVKELQDLQAVHYSMAEELRNTKDKLHEIAAERDNQREELKMARREGESAIKRGIKLQDKLRRMEDSTLPEATKGLLEQCEAVQRRCDEVQEERDMLLQQLEDLEQQHQELMAEHSDLDADYASLKVQFEGVCERLHGVDVEIEEARSKRDWAIREYNKVLGERDELRQNCQELQLQKDQAISKQTVAVRERDKLRMAMDALSMSEKRRPSPPQRPRSPKMSSRGGSVSHKHRSTYSRSTADDSAIGSLTESTLAPEHKLQEITLPPKGKDYGLILESVIYISDILPGSYAEQEGSLRLGDQLVMVNNVPAVKRLTGSEAKKLLRSGSNKHGPLLSFLARHSLPPSKILQEHSILPEEGVPPTIVPKAAGHTPLMPTKTQASPSLSARMAGRIGSLSPMVNRLVHSNSTTSSATSVSSLDLRIGLGRDFDQAEGYEPGKRSRRASISSASNCSYTSVPSLHMNHPDDSTSVISLVDEPRLVTVPITPGCGIGFKVHGGNTVGVFVTAVRDDGPKDLQRGDQILEVNGHDLRHGTMGKAMRLLTTPHEEDLKILVQYNPGKLQFMYEPAFDSFYLRCHYDYARLCDAELSFRRGDILHVVNSANSDDSYLAWRVNADGSETQLGAIPSTQRSRKLQEHYMCKKLKADDACGVQLSPFIQVDRKPAPFPRPVLLLGYIIKDVSSYLLDNYPQKFARCMTVSSFSTRQEMERELLSINIVEYTEDSGHFTSTTVDGVREIAERGQHCLLSTGASSITQLHLANLSPVVLTLRQTPSKECLKLPSNDVGGAEFLDDYQGSVYTDGAIVGSNIASIAEQVVHCIAQHQEQLVWCTAETAQV